jgi:hypothetical protein
MTHALLKGAEAGCGDVVISNKVRHFEQSEKSESSIRNLNPLNRANYPSP